jgi:glycosyltransferase
MSKVLLLANHDIVLYNFRLELIERLLLDRHEVFIVFPYGNRINDLKKLGCQYIKIDMDRHGTNPVKDLKLLANYKKVLKSIKPDMVFTYTIKPNIYGALACKALKIPCVVNITGLGIAVEQRGILQKITLALYKIALKKVQTIFFQNEENMRFFKEKKLYPEKHKLLPGSGVNLEKFIPLEYPEEKDGIRFLFIGRIMRSKGVLELFECARRIRAKYENVFFDVVGWDDGGLVVEIEKAAKERAIVFHGRQDNVISFIQKAHCIVLPSYFEGMSNVLLEAAASARPVIASDVSGCRETFEEGITGFSCKVKDVESLEAAIKQFLQLPYGKKVEMGRKGRAKVEKEYDRNIVIERYMEELTRIQRRK